LNTNPVLAGVALLFTVLLINSADVNKLATPVNRYEQATHEVVLLSTGHMFGSGVAIRRTDPTGAIRWFAWTAAHVVERTDRLEVKIFDKHNEGKTFPAKVIARNEALDVALVSLDVAPPIQPAVFNFVTPELGQEIFVVGSPYGPSYFNRISFGRVSGVDEKLDLDFWPWGRCDLFSGPVFPGNSGGPVFDESGKVLGLVVGRSSVISIYVPVRYVVVWADGAGFAWALRGDSCPAPVGEFDVPPVDLK
jgi:S1-C subfamily serine protease